MSLRQLDSPAIAELFLCQFSEIKKGYLMASTEPIKLIAESELIRKAAAFMSLVLKDEPREHTSYLTFDSLSVDSFSLNDRGFISALEKAGFTFGPGVGASRKEIVYLDGGSNQKGAEIFESDCWSWTRKEANPRLDVRFRLSISEERRGVVCLPEVWGNCGGGACHQPTIQKFVEVVAIYFVEAHALIKECVKAKPCPVISWSDIGLGGVKSVEHLFQELFGKNANVLKLAYSNISPFNPDPRNWPRKEDKLFVLEPDQPKLFKQWRTQLQEFGDSLR